MNNKSFFLLNIVTIYTQLYISCIAKHTNIQYNVYIVCNYQDDIINGAYDLRNCTLGCLCNLRKTKCEDLNVIIFEEIMAVGVLCKVTFKKGGD